MHLSVFFFNDTATTEIYTLSLHDALPIYRRMELSTGQLSSLIRPYQGSASVPSRARAHSGSRLNIGDRSEEHTSELQSRQYLVCRLLLEKKKVNELKKTIALESVERHDI